MTTLFLVLSAIAASLLCTSFARFWLVVRRAAPAGMSSRAVARGLLDATALVGESVHAVDAAAASRADFLVFGPIFDTPSKRAYGAPQGTAILRAAVAGAAVPVLAIGGVDPSNVEAVRAAGAHGVAVIRAVLAATDPAAAVRALAAAMH
jgi:thiamine-phosphate pyrophosphorylase